MRRRLIRPLAAASGLTAEVPQVPVPLVRERPIRTSAAVLLALWVFVVYSLHWLAAAHGPDVVLKVPLILFCFLIVCLLLEVPSVPALSRRWQWFAPMLGWVAAGAVTLPVALNNGYAREFLQQTMIYWTLIVATIALIDSVRRAERLLLLYGMSYLWWGLWGGTSGLVPWQPSYANYDGYGATMVGGVGICAFLALSAPKGWYKRALIAATALSLLGVVASFARGAFLGAVAIFVLVWARSNRKGVLLLAGIGGTILVVVTANLLHPGQFWAEIQSTFSEGVTEGTGEDRWELWKAGWKVWQQRPIFGVGPRNFGPFAAQFFEPGDVGGMYSRNPSILYNRSLHSVFVQVLCETGVVGSAMFAWIFVHFWRRNAALRTPEAEARWRALGGTLRLKTVALGVEASMCGFLVTAMMYPMLNAHWLFTTLALNLTLHSRVFDRNAFPAAPRPARLAGPVPGIMVPPPS